MYVIVLTLAIILALYAIVRALFLNRPAEISRSLSPSQAEEQIERLICAGRKIEAIKLHRQAHGTGLREAKEAVEAEESRLKFEGRA
jgi:ribosomal protein L7/L12